MGFDVQDALALAHHLRTRWRKEKIRLRAHWNPSESPSLVLVINDTKLLMPYV